MTIPSFTEVAKGVYRLDSMLGERILAVYVLVGDRAALLIDTGVRETPAEVIVPFLEEAGIPAEHLRYAVISHPDIDHMGGNAAMRELLPGTLLACHERDRPLAENVDRIVSERYERFSADHGIEDPDDVQAWFRDVARAAAIDIGLSGGESFVLSDDWSVRVLHTPGHSDGHLTILDPRSRALIVSDAALGEAMYTKAGEPCAAPGYYSTESYSRSIGSMLALRPDLVLTAHYPVFEGAAATDFLNTSSEFVRALDAAIKAELVSAGRSCTTRELTLAVGRRLQLWPAEVDMTAVYPVMGNLERLRNLGRVAMHRDSKPAIWEWL